MNNFFKTFKITFLLDFTTKFNSFIYNLRRIKIFRSIIPNNLYKLTTKTILTIIFSIIMFLWKISKKLIYLVVLLVFMTNIFGANYNTFFYHVLLMTTVIGIFLNYNIFKVEPKKYYATKLLNMDAKRYYFFDLIYDQIEKMIPFTIILSTYTIFLQMNPFSLVSTLVAIVLIKIIGEALLIKLYDLNINMTNWKLYLPVAFILFILTFVIPNFGLYFNQNALIYILPFLIILTIISVKYLINYDKYKQIFKNEITLDKLITSTNSEEIMKNNFKTVKEKNIVITDDRIYQKNGYAFFNDIFFARFKSRFLSQALISAGVSLLIIIAILIIMFIFKDSRPSFNNLISTSLSIFVFVMYMINSGQNISQLLFFNCDSSMLNYNFYKEKNTILSLFKLRLKSLVYVNIIPAITIGLGLVLILFFSGGTTNLLMYPSILLTIVFLSIFFSVHYLVIYYLLQPYTKELAEKNPLYSLIKGLTYFGSYMLIQANIKIEIFTIFAIIGTFTYILIALLLVYKYANKTFKIR